MLTLSIVTKYRFVILINSPADKNVSRFRRKSVKFNSSYSLRFIKLNTVSSLENNWYTQRCYFFSRGVCDTPPPPPPIVGDFSNCNDTPRNSAKNYENITEKCTNFGKLVKMESENPPPPPTFWEKKY